MRLDEHTTYSSSVLFAKLVSSKGKLGAKVSMCMHYGKDGRVVWCCTMSRLKLKRCVCRLPQANKKSPKKKASQISSLS
jgi:hypothetical protein